MPTHTAWQFTDVGPSVSWWYECALEGIRDFVAFISNSTLWTSKATNWDPFMYMHGWIPSVFIWNYHNIVNQLHAVLHLVTQSCLTLKWLLDCSPPGSSIHEDSPGKDSGVGRHALLQGIFPTQGSNSGLPHYRQILYCLNHYQLYLNTKFFLIVKKIQSSISKETSR